MCIILDACAFGDYDNSNLEPVRDWLASKPENRIAYSQTDRFECEWKHFKRRGDLWQSGKLRFVDPPKVSRQQEELEETQKLKSNDTHVIALAQVAGVKLLVTSGDNDLQADFKSIIRGKVYKYAKHEHLLREVICKG